MTGEPARPVAGRRNPRPALAGAARGPLADHVREVTELSLAYHVAAAAVPGGTGDGAGQPEIAALLRRAVAARRKLADVEEALGRLAAGSFGSCEQCGSAIPAGLLTATPEIRYCPRCDAPSCRRAAEVRPLAGRATR